MCYFIAEGYHYTKNINKYTQRLFVFSLVSHFAYVYFSANYIDWKSFIPFYYGDVLNQTSVMWPLAWGLVMLRIADSNKREYENVTRYCYLFNYFSKRLELHCKPLYFSIWYKAWKFQKANVFDDFLCGYVFNSLFLCT